MKSAQGTELLIPIDRRGTVALHVQLERQLRAAVQTGRLGADTVLPSTRALASDLGLSRGVVVEAYEQLIAEGYFNALAGSGTRVAAIGRHAAQPPRAEPLHRPFRYDFQPGTPDPVAFPRRAWLACLKRGFTAAGSDAFRYPDPRGELAARCAVAAYLGRSRATVGQPECVVMCNGYTQGINLVAQLLKARGLRRVAIEEPGFGGLARLFGGLGIEVDLMPIDEHGMETERLRQTRAEAVVVTPAHQFPTGASMNTERRAALLAWARARNALIVEDDYDSEYRYDREPLGALQGLAPGRVIYIGTASKTLSPALRIGWLLAPQDMAPELAQLKLRSDGGSPTLDQLAFTEFLTSGEMERHLRRMRPVYRQRRDCLSAALARHLPELGIRGIAAGLHLMLMLPPGSDDKALLATAQEHSMRFFGTGRFWSRQPALEQPALVLGYGCVADDAIGDGVQLLAKMIRNGGSAPGR